MLCFLVRRKLSLYVSDDLPVPVKRRMKRHLHTCRRCHVEANTLRAFHGRVEGLRAGPPPAGFLDTFAGEVMGRVARLRPDTPAPSFLQTLALSLSFQRVVLAVLLVVLSLCAIWRHDRIEAWFTRHEIERSVVTRNGMIVSDAHLQGRAANVTVYQVAGSDMIIIWLDPPPVQSGRLRRG
ncbi:MAG: zf-HC2 domain-containing protein [Candidatus Latescibacteria bacterium]|nr:zf-HC2 domain-containing protein [Candidatus Latescibacterota bacterium]